MGYLLIGEPILKPQDEGVRVWRRQSFWAREIPASRSGARVLTMMLMKNCSQRRFLHPRVGDTVDDKEVYTPIPVRLHLPYNVSISNTGILA